MSEETKVIRVVIVARSFVMQAGLEAIMNSHPGLELVGRTASLMDLDSSSLEPPDVVVLERVALNASSFPEELQSLAHWSDRLAVVVLVESLETNQVTELLQIGVRGIVPSDVTAEAMILTVEAIAAGLVVLHPEIADPWVPLLPAIGATDSPPPPLDDPLTPREIEVLQLLATGLANKAIARQLTISEHTVKFHISSIFSKLNASSRTEAVTIGMRQGLIFM